MKTLLFLRGLPASGKTTWANGKLAALNIGGKIVAVRTNKDEIRIQFGGIAESEVIRKEAELVTEALKAGLEVIIDNTHLSPDHERRYRSLTQEYGYRFELVSFMHVSLEECIRRDQRRTNPVGETVIRRMHAQYWAAKPGASTDIQDRLSQWP